MHTHTHTHTQILKNFLFFIMKPCFMLHQTTVRESCHQCHSAATRTAPLWSSPSSQVCFNYCKDCLLLPLLNTFSCDLFGWLQTKLTDIYKCTTCICVYRWKITRSVKGVPSSKFANSSQSMCLVSLCMLIPVRCRLSHLTINGNFIVCVVRPMNDNT